MEAIKTNKEGDGIAEPRSGDEKEKKKEERLMGTSFMTSVRPPRS